MSEEQIEIAAAEAGLEIARVLAFRREAGQTMTRPEQDVWDATVRFARIIATQATPDAVEAGKDASAFPPRILALLHEVADRVGTEFRGPFEDENGEPLQDDADAALAWIAAAAPLGGGER